jgi:hypothetical protein
MEPCNGLGGQAEYCPNLLPLYLCVVWLVRQRGYLEAHYAQQASGMAPLSEDDGRKPGDQ